MGPLYGVRVRAGESLTVRHIESSTAVLQASVEVLYDSGKTDVLTIAPTTGTSDRTVRAEKGSYRAKENGWVVGGEVTVSAVSTKRGQFYVDLSLSDGPGFKTIAKGYAYNGHSVTVGEFVEPGPSGGEGFLRRVALDDPAANANYADVPVTANTVWMVRGFSGDISTDANAGNRWFRIEITDGTAVSGILGSANITIVASVTAYVRGQSLASALVSVQASGAGVVIVPLSDVLLSDLMTLQFVTLNLQVTDNWGQGQLLVEEWLVPA